MARQNRKDKVTITFHYLVRNIEDERGEIVNEPIALSDFREAIERIVKTPPIDTSTQAGVDKLRFGTTVPVTALSEIEANMFFGSYQGVYTGHSYENTAKGTIPYNSASLRTFHFIVYWSKPRGRVYISTQYLGQFGDYTGLKNTIIRAFKNRKGLDAHSFRNISTAFEKVEAKEIRVEYARKGKDAGTPNTFNAGTTIVLRKVGEGGNFADQTRQKLFPVFAGPKDKIRAAVAKILREDQLIAISDDDILDCTVIAEIDGSERRYHFLNDSNVATSFPVAVGMTVEGHPDPEQLQKAMRSLLKVQVIAKSENV